MKKIIKFILLICFSLSFSSCFVRVNENQARKILEKHLENRYKEPFLVGPMGIRSTDDKEWYEARILPVKYLGTEKENDDYYWSTGTVRINKKWYGQQLGKGSDVYMVVNLNESAAEFYRPKLEELFGEKYLPVFNIDAYTIKENGDFKASHVNSLEKKQYFYIEGQIYIFAKINTDGERDAYKNKIFSFIDHMKETKTYEYVDLAFLVLDDRVLTKEFQENSELKTELIIIGTTYRDNNLELFRKERRRLMSNLPAELHYTVSMEAINKRSIRNSVEWSYYNNLYTLGIYSEKYLGTRFLKKEDYIEKDGMYLDVYPDRY